MTRDDDLFDRLEDLEQWYPPPDDPPTSDEADVEHLREMYECARDVLPPEKCDRLDDLEAELDRNGIYTDESPPWPPQDRELTAAAKEWLNLVYGEAAEAELEARGP